MNDDNDLKPIFTSGKVALLVWDVQNVLVQNIFNTETFLSNLNKVITSARQKNIPIFYSKITPLPDLFQSPVRKFLQKKMSFQLQPIPNGFDLTIDPLKHETVILKNTASIFVGTNFELMLRNAGITTIVFTGIATEIGVESSARDALNRSFYPVIIKDAVSSFDQKAHERSLENLEKLLILLNANEIIDLW